eukprot:1355007-Pleurochrysis_carterae.AAC.1
MSHISRRAWHSKPLARGHPRLARCSSPAGRLTATAALSVTLPVQSRRLLLDRVLASQLSSLPYVKMMTFE